MLLSVKMTKFYENSGKFYFELVLGPFCQFQANKIFSGKSTFFTFLFLDFYYCAKFKDEIIHRFCENLVIDAWTNIQTTMNS